MSITITDDILQIPHLTSIERFVLAAYRQSVAGFNQSAFADAHKLSRKSVSSAMRVLRVGRYVEEESAVVTQNCAADTQNRVAVTHSEVSPSPSLLSLPDGSPCTPSFTLPIIPPTTPSLGAKRAARTGGGQRERNPMFDAIAEVAQLDPKANGGRIARLAKDLRDYDPADVLHIPVMLGRDPYWSDKSITDGVIRTYVMRAQHDRTCGKKPADLGALGEILRRQWPGTPDQKQDPDFNPGEGWKLRKFQTVSIGVDGEEIKHDRFEWIPAEGGN